MFYKNLTEQFCFCKAFVQHIHIYGVGWGVVQLSGVVFHMKRRGGCTEVVQALELAVQCPPKLELAAPPSPWRC